MGFSSGTWSPPSLPGSWSPAISGQAATPDDWNTLLTGTGGIAAGLSTMICRDGQSTVTADIPFASFRLKAVGNAVLGTDAVNAGQVQNGGTNYAADTGTADLYAIAPSPAIVAYAVGQQFAFKAVHANLTTTPTLAISGLTAGTITYPDGTPLVASAINTIQITTVRVSAVTTGTPTFQLQTPSLPVNQSTTGPTTQTFTSGSAETYTRPAGVKWIKARMVGAGGGGGGIGGTLGPNGTAGGDSIFNSIHATGGGGGGGVTTLTAGTAGAAGAAGTGTATLRVLGQSGGQSAIVSGGVGQGSEGGSAPFFGGGAQAVASEGVTVITGNAGVTNTGGGGGGAISSGSVLLGPAGGGAAGEYVEIIITNPSATYVYTVGASGAGGIGTGTEAGTGGAGAAGRITVEEHYNYG